MKKAILSILTILFLGTTMSAQIVRNLYHTTKVGEINDVYFDIPNTYEIKVHGSSNILIHSKVSISSCNENIVNTYTDSLKRYDIIEEVSEKEVKLVANDKIRKSFSTAALYCTEDVFTTIYIPEEFNVIDNTFIQRPSELEEATTSKNEEK